MREASTCPSWPDHEMPGHNFASSDNASGHLYSRWDRHQEGLGVLCGLADNVSAVRGPAS